MTVYLRVLHPISAGQQEDDDWWELYDDPNEPAHIPPELMEMLEPYRVSPFRSLCDACERRRRLS